MFLFSDTKRYSYNLSLIIAAQVTLLKSNIGTWGTSVGLYGNVVVGLLTLQLDFEVDFVQEHCLVLPPLQEAKEKPKVCEGPPSCYQNHIIMHQIWILIHSRPKLLLLKDLR